MVYTIDKVLKKYGSGITVQRQGASLAFQGFLQHFRSKSQENTQRSFGPLGEIAKGRYILLAPMQPELEVGDTLIRKDLRVIIRRLETVEVNGRPAYRWGLCVEKGGD